LPNWCCGCSRPRHRQSCVACWKHTYILITPETQQTTRHSENILTTWDASSRVEKETKPGPLLTPFWSCITYYK
jgi:hypothetical protein